MTFPDDTFDAVAASFALCVAPDVASVFRQIVRVSKPGSLSAVFDYCKSRRPDMARWQELIAPAARLFGFSAGSIVWDPLRDYVRILEDIGAPFAVLEEHRFESENPFLICTRILLRNTKH